MTDPPCVVMKTLKSFGSHKVLNENASVVAVSVKLQASETLCLTFREWVCDHAVAGLKSDFWLEGVLANCAYHLQGYIWAVEDTCVIR